ncbi:MAG: DEAD/DEAH box helicase [Turicibacter sp.]|nr:DEAD/DEAH box helicase [Turicibacter sp.]
MSEPKFSDYGLSDDILKAIKGLSYETPTEVQQQVIPLILSHQDVTVKSQTGSGKTAAFGIPLCQLVEWNENKPQALILTPTRELAQQVSEDLTNIGRFKRLKALAIFGKSPFRIQQAVLKQRTHIVVGTPGRVFDHIQRETLSLEKIRYLIIDEADEMLNMGFLEQVEAIIKCLPKERVTLLFSATFPEDIARLSQRHMNHPAEVQIKAQEVTANTITHQVLEAKGDKVEMLKDLLIFESPDSAIIFCRTQENVEDVYRQLSDDGLPVERIHGGMEQDQRFGVMDAFRRGKFRYLVATDVAARGIDISHITHVINFDIPLEKEAYVHRAGRTGRAGQSGKAITLATTRDVRRISEIEDYIGFSLDRVFAPTSEEVRQKKSQFEKKIQQGTLPKTDKREQLSKEIFKLNFNGGKKKKLRAVDFVGAIAKIDGITADDIGIITILDHSTDVEILNGKGRQVLEAMRTTTVKGKQLKVRRGARR